MSLIGYLLVLIEVQADGVVVGDGCIVAEVFIDYADDIYPTAAGRNIHMEHLLHRVVNYSGSVGFKIKPSKTKVVALHGPALCRFAGKRSK